MLEPSRNLLLRIAGGGSLRLGTGEEPLLVRLEEEGQVDRLDSAPRHADLESRYEALQDTLRRFQEAKACLDRLERRLAPRSRLGGLLPAGKAAPLPASDPDLQRMAALLKALDVQLPGLERIEDIPARLERIQDGLVVDSRACLSRMALLDRELDSLQKTAPTGAQIEGYGNYALTEAAERSLPEAEPMEALETAFNALAGSNRYRIDDYAHFRDDPADLLAFVLEGQARGGRPSQIVSDFEALADAFDHLAPFREIRSMRIRNAFLIRLIRAHPGQPRAPYLWCHRERFQGLLARMSELAPSSVVTSRWHLLYAEDLLIAGSAGTPPLQMDARRLQAYELVQRRLGQDLESVDIGDGQYLRLALAILHEILPLDAARPPFLERTISRMVASAFEGMAQAPADLGGPGARLLFGYHLAHFARFMPERVGAAAQAFARVERAFLDAQGRVVPLQVVLHALVALERIAQAGLPVDPEEYAGTVARIRRRLRQHKGLVRAFSSEMATADDEPFLAANLAARAYMGQALREAEGTHPGLPRPDVGLAGLYEPQDPRGAPILGLPFGTLMLS